MITSWHLTLVSLWAGSSASWAGRWAPVLCSDTSMKHCRLMPTLLAATDRQTDGRLLEMSTNHNAHQVSDERVVFLYQWVWAIFLAARTAWMFPPLLRIYWQMSTICVYYQAVHYSRISLSGIECRPNISIFLLTITLIVLEFCEELRQIICCFSLVSFIVRFPRLTYVDLNAGLPRRWHVTFGTFPLNTVV